MAFRKEKGYVTRLFHYHTLPQHIKRTIALSQYNTAQHSNRRVSGRQYKGRAYATLVSVVCLSSGTGELRL